MNNCSSSPQPKGDTLGHVRHWPSLPWRELSDCVITQGQGCIFRLGNKCRCFGVVVVERQETITQQLCSISLTLSLNCTFASASTCWVVARRKVKWGCLSGRYPSDLHHGYFLRYNSTVALLHQLMVIPGFSLERTSNGATGADLLMQDFIKALKVTRVIRYT